MVLDFLEFPGITAGICLVGVALWSLGVRQPFILAATSLLIGGPIGWLAERWFVALLRRAATRVRTTQKAD